MEDTQHFFVAVKVKHSLIFAPCLEADDLAYDPDDAKDVVGMGVCDKHVVDVGETDVGILHLSKDAIAPSGVHQQIVAIVLKNKAGVIAPSDHCVAGAEDDESIVHVI